MIEVNCVDVQSLGSKPEENEQEQHVIKSRQRKILGGNVTATPVKACETQGLMRASARSLLRFW